jgi:glycosyltransferase involved in cell wall biosynthesis
VLEAHALLPAALRERYPLAVVGMHGWGMDQLPERTRRAVEAGQVRLLGYLPQEQMPAIYSGARAFAYPSIYEGFGLPPLEAMACGVPVVVSSRASLPELVGDAGTMVEPEDAVALARALESLLEDPARHAQCSRAGRSRAATFTWQRCALETRAIYEKVLS